jgi:DNA-3-methyladenine glycosylase I
MASQKSSSGPLRPEPEASAAEPSRCQWAAGAFLQPYHDEEWGVPVHDDRRHFEFLVLESAQAGLSWITILKRRDGYRQAFCNFDPEAVAELEPADVARLLGDPGIIRNRRKVESAITNARAFLEIRRQFGSFDSYVWCRRPAVGQRLAGRVGDTGRDAAVEGAERGPETAGIQVSGPGCLLRAPAGDRARDGPRDELLSLERAQRPKVNRDDCPRNGPPGGRSSVPDDVAHPGERGEELG